MIAHLRDVSLITGLLQLREQLLSVSRKVFAASARG
jgi:hypothetical protein